MAAVTIGLLHPGEMGAAVGAALAAEGKEVRWASEGRSPATTGRAATAALTDAGTVASVVAQSELVLSVCPPHAALQVAATVAAAARGKRDWSYLDANAIAPATSRQVAQIVEAAGATFVDGGIIGPPPDQPGLTRLYLSGPAAVETSETLASPLIEIHVLGDDPAAASALKLAYSAWTKGSAALLLAARAAAVRSGVDAALIAEWRTSQPGVLERWERSRQSSERKGWRWAGEMEEIASMFESLGLPPGFHAAAARVFGDATTVA